MLMTKLRDMQDKYGAPRWMYIYYAMMYALIFTVAMVISTK